MKARVIGVGLVLLLVAAIWLGWPQRNTSPAASAGAAASVPLTAITPPAPAATVPRKVSVLNTNALAYRLANSTNSIAWLTRRPHAILLENALIDTEIRKGLDIPDHLRHHQPPGAYIVQARNAPNEKFRSLLTWAGAQVVSYIPNNAYLVRMSDTQVSALAGSPLVQAVLPYEPYYKIQSSLIGLAVNGQTLPGGTALTLGLFANDAANTEAQIKQLGAQIVGTDRSPFGPVLHVQPPATPDGWVQLAQLSGVQLIEVARPRHVANDLSRVTVGISPDTLSATNYLNLAGSNVTVVVNDSGIDFTHPDFNIGGSETAGQQSGTPTRVLGDSPLSLVDTNGHGTVVAGIIGGNGEMSQTLNTNEPQGSITNADFRGKAPAAWLFSVGAVNGFDPFAISDYYLQSLPALTNALIDNNSWGYGQNGYDLAAASYDAATRDALPLVPGSQPVLFVFAAGNDGFGEHNGFGGQPDTVESPGSAKNVITVGALEQLRGITNKVTFYGTGGSSNQTEYWYSDTDSGSQVSWSSSRGNVGIGTEGQYGRFKPDVVLPGNFVVSTRSSQWDTNTYYNNTNATTVTYPNQSVETNQLNAYNVIVPQNCVGVNISVTANQYSTIFPGNLPVYVKQSGVPTATSFDFKTTKDGVSLPPDGGAGYLAGVLGSGFWFAVGDNTNQSINYDVSVTIFTTNGLNNIEQVFMQMNEKLAPWYRYESGTSMAAGGASGLLALMQDFFTNQLHSVPSPALMKAMLINGSRPPGDYTYAITNGVNYAGWGLPNIQDILPYAGGTNGATATNGPIFFVDQSPTNALATGDSHTYTIYLDTNNLANLLTLQVTLAWTDPPGNPAAAVKLVNGLELIVTNLDTGDVFYGNDFPGDSTYNNPWDTNQVPNIDVINNVENVCLAPLLGGSYSITVLGRSVNVNAVTAQTNNTVQDYALVVTCGEGEVPTAITSVTDNGIASNPTGDQDITFITTTNSPYFNQMAGANTPLLGTNTQALGPTYYFGTNGQLTVGMTNQWHFYVVTNNYIPTDGNSANHVTNAVFLTFNAGTLSLPRMGVFADSETDSTRPTAALTLFASTDPGLTNLSAVTLSNCMFNVGDNKSDTELTGTEFVYFTDSSPGTVYYVAVQSQDQMGAEYDFMPIFTDTPLTSNDNGNLLANGLLLPGLIPDGDPAHPGVTNVFAICVPQLGNMDPSVQIANVIVTNQIWHQNYGDLFGELKSPSSTAVVLNNHDALGNTYNKAARVYNDSRVNTNGTVRTDAPGRGLRQFVGQGAIGPWIQFQMDNALTHTGQVQNFSLEIQPHRDFKRPGIIVSVPAGGWYEDYVTVPVGYEELFLYATNVTQPYATQPIQFYEAFNQQPTFTIYDQETLLTNCLTGIFNAGGVYPGNQISTGPPLPMGLYYIGLYNPNSVAQSIFIDYNLVPVPVSSYVTTNGGTIGITPDVVNQSSLFVTSTQQVAAATVGVVLQNVRVSDLALTLVNQTTGQRVLLMENRGGPNANQAGGVFVYTNILNATATGGAAANTNYFNTGTPAGSIPITYNFFTVPDEMTVYYGTNLTAPNLVWDSGMINNPGDVPVTVSLTYPPPGATTLNSTYLTIVMNQFGNTNGAGGDQWTYTAGATVTNYQYLTFTDDTNLTTIPIGYAIPPYDLNDDGTNFVFGNLDLLTNHTYVGPTNIADPFGGWSVPTNVVVIQQVVSNAAFVTVTNVIALTNNEVSVVTDPTIALEPGSNFLALADGYITRTVPTTPGRIYNFTYWYRGPGIAGWWRGEGNALDSSDPEHNANNGALIGRFTFPQGEVGQSFGMDNPGQMFVFAGTNAYVQIPQPPLTVSNTVTLTNGVTTNLLVQTSALDVGTGPGFTVEGWINPTNVTFAQPLVEWLARVPTNILVTNLVVKAGPFLSPVNNHYYYLLGTNSYTNAEYLAEQLGGHLATVRNANEENWIYDRFGNYGGVNRNLWIGLTNSPADPGAFGWLSGETNGFRNWLTGQPADPDGTRVYTAILGGTNNPAKLWVLTDINGNYGQTSTNRFYGVAEVASLQPPGVQFWVSLTNSAATNAFGQSLAGSTNGCLYANLVDSTNGNHEIFSLGGLVQTNVFQHVALTYDTNSGIANLYYNGTNVASTNLGYFIPKTTGDVLLGKDLTLRTNNAFFGDLDEMSIYVRPLSPAEIRAIYRASALATNGLTGKFDPAATPADGLAEAVVTINGVTNEIYGFNNQWALGSYTFTATTNFTTVQIQGLQPGILLDNFAAAEAALTNLYYLPETPLSGLIGDTAYGQWTLELWDTRTSTNLNSQLVSWQLQFTVQTNPPVNVSPEALVTNSVPPNSITYYAIQVPAWAQEATNILVSASSPVTLLYNQTSLPTGSNPGDYTLLTTGAGTNAYTLFAATPALPVPPPPQLYPGTTYYLGVQNNGSQSATVVLTVDFNLIALSNGVPYSDVLGTNTPGDQQRYYVFNVDSNAYAATFQLLHLNANADLVLSQGAPLPSLTNCAYGSFNPSNANENIYVLTNSAPVPLAPGTWYLGVMRRGAGPVAYTVLAQDVAASAINIINLSNNVPFTWTAGPGAALTNFFHFAVADSPPSVHFELYNLTGNGDLTVQTNALPLAPPFLQASAQPGRTPELIYLTTNNVMTNLAANWYLGVPNQGTNLISFTILAVEDTNVVFPAFPGAEGCGAGAGDAGVAGSVMHFDNVTNVYHVTSLADGGTNTLRDALSQSNRTVVFDISGTINLTNGPLVVTNSFLTVAGQTAPGDGIAVTGDSFVLQSAHDVVLRYLRFRPGAAVTGDAIQCTNATNVILDHLSVTWDANNLVSVLNCSNVTVQWSILADSLYNDANPTGEAALVRSGSGPVTFHHNLFANNYSGNPQIDDNLTLDFVNNVVYNWGVFSGLSGTNDALVDVNGYTNQLNYACNYLIAGLNTTWFATNAAITNIAFAGGTPNTWIWQTNNLIDSNTNGLLDGGYTGWSMFTNQFTKVTKRFNVPSVGTDEGYVAYERVLDFAGTALTQRDQVDRRIVDGVITQSGVFRRVPEQTPVLNSAFPWQNSSGDGIPDFWKTTFGLTISNAYNAVPTTNANFIGYSWLEEYLAWLAQPHALTTPGSPVNINLFRLSGGDRALAFQVTNAINGSVYLTNDPANPLVDPVTGLTNLNIAVFTPSNNIAGYAYFDYYITNFQNVVTNSSGVTNPAYSAFTGPVTVSVLVAVTNGGNLTEVLPLTPGLPQTNLIGPNSVGWYLVTVPTNAFFATNALLSLTAPGQTSPAVNFWWSINTPPGMNPAAGDDELLTNGTSGSAAVLGINSTPALVPGTTYFLGVQNTNGFGVLSVAEVTFAYSTNGGIFLRNLPNLFLVAGQELIVTNTAFDANPGYVAYSLATNPPALGAAIDTNGIITWPSSTNDAGTNYTFTTIATDTNSLLSATNSFIVTVVPGVTNGSGLTNVVGAGQTAWYVVQVPTNALAATNVLLSESLPLNLWWSTNLPPGPSPLSNDFELLTNVLGGTNVLTPTTVPALVRGSAYLLGIQNTNSVAVTNTLEVTFAFPPAPVFATNPPNFAIPPGYLLVVTNSASDTNGTVLAYQLAVSPVPPTNAPVITPTNGVISWTPTTNNIGFTYAFVTTAYDPATGMSASNQFFVTVEPLLTPGVGLTNVVASNSVAWYLVAVPTNALAATNTLLSLSSAALNLWWSTNVPPGINPTNGDVELLTNTLAGADVITTATNSVPQLVPGGEYLLGVQNTNSTAATNVLTVTFDLATPVFSLASVTYTNIGGTNGWLLAWSAPAAYQFHVQWTGVLPTTNWHTFPGVISDWTFRSNSSSPFQFLDDGSRSGGLGTNRYYRLLLLNSPTNTAPFFLNTNIPNQTYLVPAGTLFTLTNSASDWDIPAQTLTYSDFIIPVGTNRPAINPTNGIISWTPDYSLAGTTNQITMTVADNGIPSQSVQSTFFVVVPPLPVPVITNVTIGAGNVVLQWSGSNGEPFQVRWATNLNAPIQWQSLAGPLTYTNGVFTFKDTNSQGAAKFYQLVVP